MKKLCALLISGLMLMSMVSCSGGSSSAPSSAAPSAAAPGSSAAAGTGEKVTLNLATGGTSGTYYAVGNGMGTILGDKLSLSSLAVQSTGASKANVYLIADKEVDLAILQGDVLAYAHEGSDLFKDDGAETSAQWVAALYNETVQIIAAPDIKSVEDLRGKSVCVGDVGSGTEFNARQILEAYGMTFDDIVAVNGSFSDGVESLKDKKISAAFTVAGAPTTAIVDLSTTNSFNMLSLSNEAVEYLTSHYPFLTLDPLPAGTYKGIDQETNCVAVKAVLVASEEVSEDVIYELTKAMFENKEALAGGHAKFKLLDPKTAVDGLGKLPMHPGAQKYYKEIGIM